VTEDPHKVVDLHPSEWESEKHSPKRTQYEDFLGAVFIAACALIYLWFTA
jgi:hypothetical protein